MRTGGPLAGRIPGPASIITACLLATSLASSALAGDSILEQWREGLRGARLTAYSGSVISSNSTLTVIRLCSDGRFDYRREGSWSVPGQAGGASQSAITGRWWVERAAHGGIEVRYVTDAGQRGAYPAYLQNDGRVNLGGEAYRAERGAAGC